MKTLPTLGARLRYARELRGYTQIALAAACGVKQPTISELETGESKSISDETLIGVCHVLRIRHEWLVRGDEPMEPPEHTITPVTVEIARKYEKLTPDGREKVSRLINQLVAEEAGKYVVGQQEQTGTKAVEPASGGQSASGPTTWPGRVGPRLKAALRKGKLEK